MFGPTQVLSVETNIRKRGTYESILEVEFIIRALYRTAIVDRDNFSGGLPVPVVFFKCKQVCLHEDHPPPKQDVKPTALTSSMSSCTSTAYSSIPT